MPDGDFVSKLLFHDASESQPTLMNFFQLIHETESWFMLP
jgi:hypothetical protein